MIDLAIVTLSAKSPDTLSLYNSALKQGYNAVITVIGADDVIDVLSNSNKVILRIGPSSYEYYKSILDQVPEKNRLAIRNMLYGFDKGVTYQILTANGISTPITSLHKRGLEPQSYPIVMKILNGNQGIGVALVSDRADYRHFEENYPNQKIFVAQEYIAEAQKQDKRLLVVGDACVAAMRRSSASDDFRANLHTGGVAENYSPTSDEVSLAVRAAKAFNLPYAGVDIIDSARGPLVLEINPSPGLAVSRVAGVDVAARIVEAVMATDYDS